ncbi:hypothetical protein TRFO_01511 [Tritrichomonas foetus]|uniref:Uncharacterized protein n=1 Tax=Tritrichomonas foetus TaxID=1144522 RepID=A0A1J4JZA3_9EUKA|nr:hypothetical protein TRFO_01511 [Tritrichomonas foetus]|eukprot:OHT03816.1 hypothetical protein TRFO_01511 [Tritrichomonas foetus]
MNFFDVLAILLIFALSFSVRIWKISYPDCVVFDEFHFGQFINDYHDGNYFFDIHPPTCKLLLYFFSSITQYDGSLSFQNPNSQYCNEYYVFLRIIPAILTSFVPVFIFVMLKNINLSSFGSLFGSFLLIFEHSLISQSKFILIEGIQHFFVSFHLLLLSINISNFSETTSNSKKEFFVNFFIHFFHHCLLGVSLGLCISCKMTAFSLIPFTIIGKLTKINFSSIFNIIVMVFVSFSILITMFIIHLKMLPNPTHDLCFIHSSFQDKQSNNSTNYLKDAITTFFSMNRINQRNKQFHPYMSHPSSWPFLRGIWVGMWINEDGNSQINCMGNVFVYYSVLLGLIIRIIQISLLLFSFFKQIYEIYKKSKKSSPRISFITQFLTSLINGLFITSNNIGLISILGWIFAYFPFYFVKRTTFLYHYQIALIFGIINFCYCFDNHKLIILFASFFSIYGFIYWKPFLYGDYLSEIQIMKLVWTKLWRYGDERHKNLVENFFDDFHF